MLSMRGDLLHNATALANVDKIFHSTCLIYYLTHCTMSNASARSKNIELLMGWTGGEFGPIQRNRRGQGSNGQSNAKTKRAYMNVDSAVARFMRNSACRAPERPPYSSRYVFRGIGGAAGTRLLRDGSLIDKGYIAFSADIEMASLFTFRYVNYSERDPRGSTPIIAKLDLESLPKGLPYIWFGDKSNGRCMVKSAHSGEEEVLFPPGTLRVVRRERNHLEDNIPVQVVLVKYFPDTKATNLTGGIRIHAPRPRPSNTSIGSTNASGQRRAPASPTRRSTTAAPRSRADSTKTTKSANANTKKRPSTAYTNRSNSAKIQRR